MTLSLERLLGLACLMSIAGLPGAPLADKPQRIVSMNLCVDQLLMALVEPARIASVSFLSADPNSSALAGQAQRFPLNHGLAEEILPLEPDLVLASTVTGQPTVGLLRSFGYRVVQLPLAEKLSDVAAQLTLVGEAVGEVERGRALIGEFEARLAALQPEMGAARPRAAVYGANGYTYGPGTLVGEVVEAAGFDNLAREMDLDGITHLPLEVLVAGRPDVLILGVAPHERPALAGEVLRHPALRRAFPPATRLIVPEPLWNCGAPAVAEAAERLAELRRRVVAGGRARIDG